jgi:hypothetical protein
MQRVLPAIAVLIALGGATPATASSVEGKLCVRNEGGFIVTGVAGVPIPDNGPRFTTDIRNFPVRQEKCGDIPVGRSKIRIDIAAGKPCEVIVEARAGGMVRIRVTGTTLNPSCERM